ncbi:hypothetical protein DIPPA_28497 [Diplonema papillatum]|nr:hypothetical protein DIPPA_28497 [Diplonema papillatum]
MSAFMKALAKRKANSDEKTESEAASKPSSKRGSLATAGEPVDVVTIVETEEDARKAVLQQDSDVVAQAATRAGKDKWSRMSWKGRLQAVISPEPDAADSGKPPAAPSKKSDSVASVKSGSKPASREGSRASLSKPNPTLEAEAAGITLTFDAPESRVSSRAATPAAESIKPSNPATRTSSFQLDSAQPQSKPPDTPPDQGLGSRHSTGHSTRAPGSSAKPSLAAPGLPPPTPTQADINPRASMPRSCPNCARLQGENDALRKKVAELEAAAHAKKKHHPKHRKDPHGHPADDDLHHEIDELKRELAAERAKPGSGPEDAEDTALLLQQLWTLEQALGLRNSTIAKLHRIMDQSVAQIKQLDRQLSEALGRVVHQARADAEEEERQVFGGVTAEDAVAAAKKKRKAKRRGTKTAGAGVQELEWEVDVLKREIASLGKGGGAGLSGDEKDAVIARLRGQLKKAHEAILSGVEQGQEIRKEADLKLRQTRAVLSTIVQHKRGTSQAASPRSPHREQPPPHHLIPPPSSDVVVSIANRPALRAQQSRTVSPSRGAHAAVAPIPMFVVP